MEPSSQRSPSRRASNAPPRVGEQPPPYVRRRHTIAQPVPPHEPTKHAYHLKDNNRDWVTLELYSSAKSSKSLPIYSERENISGSLKINGERGDSIHSITAEVTGRIITGIHASDSLTFLNQSLPIWAKSADVPRLSSPSEGTSGSKLLGLCEWPLSIPLPRVVTVPWPRGSTQTYHLPGTFSERHINASIRYEFTIVIGRGRFRPDSHINTAFAYIPRTKPEPTSLLRQLAYEELSPLPGPDSDPEGWESLDSVPCRGHILPNHPVNIQCTVSLAKPLCYTRGTLIPCTLKLECGDKNVLDMFAVPASIALHLRRRVRFYSKPSELKQRQDIAWNESVAEMGAAIWWPAPNLTRGSSSRYLEGEIKLAKDLKPTTAICHFSISYFVVLSSFQIPNFTSDGQELSLKKVEIATVNADGPLHHSYSDAPAHDHNAQQSDEYYASVMSPSAGSWYSTLGA